MSGGNWDYFHTRFSYELDEFCNDIKERFPELSEKLLSKGKVLCDIINDIDYDVSGDTIIKSDHDFEKEALSRLANSEDQ